MSRPGARPRLYGDLRTWALVAGDSLELLSRFPDRSVDSIVTDPPYGIDISRKGWDGGPLAGPQVFEQFSEAWASEAVRVLKPGGHLVAFGSPRTFHRLVGGVEDAGLEIRDTLVWLHGRGVPKAGVDPQGIGLGLRPAFEPILLARAPLRGSAATTIATFGTGGLNIEATRVPRSDGRPGYWPSPVILSHEPACDALSCTATCTAAAVDRLGSPHWPLSRMFFAAKTDRAEREAGLADLPATTNSGVFASDVALKRPRANAHPTVKPIDLMRWLVRLTCPPHGLVLDPFAGSGTTGIAAGLEGRQFIGIELESEYVRIARARLSHWLAANPNACGIDNSRSQSDQAGVR